MKTFLTIVLTLALLAGLGLKKAWGQDPWHDASMYDVTVSLMYDNASLDHMPMQSVGLGAALLLNERTFIGFYGMSLQDQSPLSLREGDVFTPRDDVSFSHMGMWVGYIHQPQNRLHLVMSSQIGTGGLSHESGETLTTEQVFLINPQVGVEVRLTNWLSFNAGVGYRWVSHPEEAIFRDIDFGRVSTHLQLRLGGFQ